MQTNQKSALGINGIRKSGMEVRKENATAAIAVANVVKSSLGPIGLDKMLVDEVGDVVVTNDGATILKRLDVEHPVARRLVELAQLQDKEIGDGTTSVVIIGAELLRRAQELVAQGIHPSVISSGYKLALRESVNYITDRLSAPVVSLGTNVLLNVAKTSMSSKVLNSDADHFAKIVVDAILSVRTVNELGDVTYPRNAVGILSVHGRSARESKLVQGFVIPGGRAAQGMPAAINKAKIALIDFDLRAVKMKLGVNITVTDVTKAEAIRQREIDITKERIQKIIDAGATVILTSWGIDDTMMKMLVEAGVLGMRRVKKDDMRRIAKATEATIVHSLSDLSGDEVFDPTWLGYAERVCEEHCGDGAEYVQITGTKNAVSASILCRGANYFVLEEMERALNDALWAVARALEAQHVVAGGGSVETALSVYLENLATTISSVQQLAVAEFAQVLLIIPKTLALNAALDATDIVSKLRVAHYKALTDTAQIKIRKSRASTVAEVSVPPNGERELMTVSVHSKESELRFTGLDLEEGCIRNNLQAGVLEPESSKIKSLKFATEACLSILRIDDCIRLNPEEQQ